MSRMKARKRHSGRLIKERFLDDHLAGEESNSRQSNRSVLMICIFGNFKRLLFFHEIPCTDLLVRLVAGSG